MNRCTWLGQNLRAHVFATARKLFNFKIIRYIGAYIKSRWQNRIFWSFTIAT